MSILDPLSSCIRQAKKNLIENSCYHLTGEHAGEDWGLRGVHSPDGPESGGGAMEKRSSGNPYPSVRRHHLAFHRKVWTGNRWVADAHGNRVGPKDR
jgi:hypothetical protein